MTMTLTRTTASPGHQIFLMMAHPRAQDHSALRRLPRQTENVAAARAQALLLISIPG